jgi:hypothetical protein
VKNGTVVAASDADRSPHAATRLVKREPSDRVAAIGLPNPWLSDFYHNLLTLPWWAFLVGLAVVYLGLNVLFAELYLLGARAIANARPGYASSGKNLRVLARISHMG